MAEDLFDYGSYVYGDAPYDPNTNTWDPASANYNGVTSDWFRSGGGSSYPSAGSGQYRIGEGDWQGINAPGRDSYNPYETYSRQPTGGNNPTYTSIVEQQKAEAAAALWSMGIGSPPSTGGGGSAPRSGGGSSSYTPQPYQRMTLGAPERTLYDRYSSLLQNPAGMQSDPAYTFLFNQGQQALNRSLAAKRLSYSGKALGETAAYGQGMAYDYMNKLLPQYQAGAQEELRRFMGPAGLLPSYTGANNQVTSREGSDAASKELLPYYQRMLDSQMGGGGSSAGPSYGGLTGGYNFQPRLQAAMGPGGSTGYQPPASLDSWGTTYPETVDYSWMDRP